MFDDGVTPFALSALKYALFALLFLFVWRSMRWVARGVAVEPVPRTAPAHAGPARPEAAALVVQQPDDRRPRVVPLDASVVIGRAPECELRLDDAFVSSQHARIFARNGSWYVEDLGSTNGTFVNEQRLGAPAMLQPGDRIRIGRTTVELRR